MATGKSTTVRAAVMAAPSTMAARPTATAARSTAMSAPPTATIGSTGTTDVTAVRPRLAPAPLRATFRALEATSPATAGVLAERLWFRLPRRASEERRDRFAPEGGRELTVAWAGGTLRGVAYGREDAPTAYLVHGWGGWWQQLGAHVQPLVDAGYRVVAYDAPSHGSSARGRHGPRSTTLIEMAEAQAAVVRQEGPAHLVVAHSIGAVVSLWAGAHEGARASAYAFLAPASTISSMVRWFEQVLDVGPRSQRVLIDRVERRVGHRVDAFEIVALAGQVLGDRMTPALLTAHDPADPETPVGGSLDLVETWPGAEMSLVEGLGHRRLLWDADVVASVADFARRARVS
jgi:pimeloyl-ACP methyl ester carboxylesterase